MLARHEGQVVFVAGAIPGERVRARVERVSKQLAFAETIDVLEAEPRSPVVDSRLGVRRLALRAHRLRAPVRVEIGDLSSDSFARIGKMRCLGRCL